ncbi:hypothetical protein ScPMuIL_002640 [Solemya velum]
MSSTSLQEHQTVTLTCDGSVGNPAGSIKWSRTKDGVTAKLTGASNQVPESCWFKDTSTLAYTVTRDDNGAQIGCSIVQPKYVPNPAVMRTDALNVYYLPSINEVNPEVQPSYPEGTASVRLTCHGEGNPEPDYKWVHEVDGSETVGQELVLTNLKINQTGDYTCVVNNSFNGVSYSDNRTYLINIVETTANPQTTTGTPTTDNVEGYPCEARHLSVESLTPKSITVTWSAGCNGGTEQTFYVQHRKSTDRADDSWKTGSPVSENEAHVYTIKGLDPDTGYHIRVMSQNKKGETYSEYNGVRTPAEEELQTGPIVGGVMGAVVLVVVCVVVFIMWRKGLFKKEGLPCLRDKTGSDGVYVNDAFSPDGQSNADGNYQDLGPTENPSIHYAHLGGSQPAETNLHVYTEVQ